MSAAAADSVDAVFKALAEPKRREMMQLLRVAPLSVTEIASHFDITQQAVSLHLRVLRNAALVTDERVGPRHLYLVRPEGLDGVHRFVEDLWPAALRRLKAVVEADHAP